MRAPRPYTLVAELTYACPLACPYCSNPVRLGSRQDELDTDTWLRVLEEAAGLGVLQLHFTGGEPLVRRDLERLISAARALGLYQNLITSGQPLTRHRFDALVAAGLDCVQLSFQDSDPETSNTLAGGHFFEQKLAVARWVKEVGLPLTTNVVLHRWNLDHVSEIIALAEELKSDRLELANTQYAGWRSRTALRSCQPRAGREKGGRSRHRRASACWGQWRSSTSRPTIFRAGQRHA